MGDNILAALRKGFTDPVRDVLWGHIYFTPALAALAGSAPFMRLYRIFQLGPAFCVYPGATHTRASHSIGVYHLSRRLIINLAEQGAEEWLSERGVFSFLCAALLHDVGHFPYTHSLKELALESHEKLTGKIIREEPVRSLVTAAEADPDLTAAIVDASLPGGENRELTFFRRLLSGVLDPDKLDYLNRDARYCGVPYGAQDVDFIFSRLLPHPERGVDIDSRGIPSVESILFSKYLMYRTVYWHREVRAATAMIKKALLGGLEDGTLSGDELYGLDDQGLFALLAEKRHPLFRLAAAVRDGKLYHEAAVFPFEEGKHRVLLDLEKRNLQEAALARAIRAAGETGLTADELIIDVPEPVSFETGLYVRDEERYFAESASVFREQADVFTRSLRVVRIFTARPLKIPENILQNGEKWLHSIDGGN